MKVAFLPFGKHLASFRLRSLVPASYLAGQAHSVVFHPSERADWIVLSKHDWPEDMTIGAKRVCFDVCDDHFGGRHDAHYRKWLDKADLVTCNSAEMRRVIKSQTGRDAIVIDDPYESPEYPPKRPHLPLLWFGAFWNLAYLRPWLDRLPHQLVVVTNEQHGEMTNTWDEATMEAAWQHCGLVIIPTGSKQAKSANRAVESIRRGLYPVCGPLPAYEELGLNEDIVEGVSRALDNPADTLTRIEELQDLIRERFSPMTVGATWERVLASGHS